MNIPIPAKRLILLLVFPLLLYITGVYFSYFIYIGLLLDTALIAVTILDIINSIKVKDIRIELQPVPIFSIGRIHKIEFHIINSSNKVFNFEIKIDIPEGIVDMTHYNSQCVYNKGASMIKLKPLRRGEFLIKNVYVKYKSFLALFNLHYEKVVNITVKVRPDIIEIKKYFTLLKKNRLIYAGIKNSRYRGMGTDIEYLKDYHRDEDARLIDWKASTRVCRTVSKVFQAETNRHITFAIDCGRMMTADQGDLSSLDHAVNTVLMLSHIAHRLGDRIYIVVFSDRIIGEIQSDNTKKALQKINTFLTKLQPEFVESNYSFVFRYIEKKIKRRSLILVFSDIIDDLNYECFKSGFMQLKNKHFPLFVLLKDNILHHAAEKHVKDEEDLFMSISAREMMINRKNGLTKLKKHRINVLDTSPSSLTPGLINKYIEVKSKNLL